MFPRHDVACFLGLLVLSRHAVLPLPYRERWNLEELGVDMADIHYKSWIYPIHAVIVGLML